MRACLLRGTISSLLIRPADFPRGSRRTSGAVSMIFCLKDDARVNETLLNGIEVFNCVLTYMKTGCQNSFSDCRLHLFFCRCRVKIAGFYFRCGFSRSSAGWEEFRSRAVFSCSPSRPKSTSKALLIRQSPLRTWHSVG